MAELKKDGIRAAMSEQTERTALPPEVGEQDLVKCPVCKDMVPEDSMLSYNNVPDAFCQQCVDSGKV